MQELKLSENTILVVPSFLQKKVIKKLRDQQLKNIKIMSLEEVRKKYDFDYDDKAIYYLMKNHHYQYEVAKMYLTHLYEVENEDFNSPKIKKIIEIKKELKKNNLLIYHDFFKSYLQDKKLVFYNYRNLNRLDQKLIAELKNICSVEFYNEQKEQYNQKYIFEFDTLEEEVIYVAGKICELVETGISMNQIKIYKGSSEYFPVIKRIFEWYHIPISICDNKLYATTIGQDFLKHLAPDPQSSLKYIEEHYSLKDPNLLDIYNKIIQILNQYVWVDSLLEIKEFLVEDFKNTIIGEVHYQEEVTMIDSLESASVSDYVFLIGFNQGEIPKCYKDESYFNDSLKKKLGLDTTSEMNLAIYKKWLTEIQETKNLIITYKKNSSLGVHYVSSLNDDLKLEIQKEKITYRYSHLFNQIKLAEKIDTLIKYNEKEEDLELLYANYPNLSYGSYCADYQKINKEKLKEFLNHQLVLSYSAMNSYYQCAFRYYLSNILKLNIYEETFYTIIGNAFHHVLSLCFKKEINVKKEYQDYLEKCSYPLNDREKFFLNHLEKELEFIIQTIQKQNETNSLKKLYVEEKIVVPKNKDNMEISFKGFVDKLFTNEEESIAAIIDYKTGNPELNLNHIIYGLDLQLPVYIYLARKKFPNIKIAGFYLQKILNTEINRDNKHTYEYLKEDKLKLQGYSNSDPSILEKFDSSYYESKTIKGMRTTSKGIASKKVLNNAQLDKLEEITEQKIKEAIDGILNANFEINPKRVGMDNLGCKYCSFKDICFQTEKNVVSLKEYKNMEFLGGDEDDTNETNECYLD